MSAPPLAYSPVTPEGQLVEMLIGMGYPGMEAVFSGDPGALEVDFDAQSIEVVLNSLAVGGEIVDLDVRATVAGVVGS